MSSEAERGLMLPTLRDGAVTLRPLQEADLDALVAIVTQPGIREWWGTSGTREGLHDEEAFTIEVAGELAGWLGWEEELEPDYRHVGLDLFLAAAHQGHGHGPTALRLAARWFARERGHHRFTIDPARENERAIRAYRRAGFRPVGVLRRYERALDGTWRDGLLMDLLAEELPG